jgi:putative peptide zinc metalloprotease protein
MRDYCAWPPQIAADVEVSEQQDGARPVFIVSSASVGRYLLLRTVEYRVLRLLDEKHAPGAVCDEFLRRHGASLTRATLTKFLSRLDETGILAGEREGGYQRLDQGANAQFYNRFKLFNPDPLFTRMVYVFRWIWTTEFFAGSLLLMLAAAALALINRAEVAHYSVYILRERYVAVLVAGLLVGVTHEFAHGLTCKAFGGRATEVGVLMIYYFLPALYCNVSGVHLIPQRRRRLWVIAAGVYWQLLAGTLALLAWFALAPYTALADLAFCFFLGGALDVVFNGNPLIKLDGYYFLSQWLRAPNLMDRACEYRRGLLRRVLFGEPNEMAMKFSRREQAILAVFGLLSFVYTVALRSFIVIFVGSYLIDWWGLPGLSLTLVLAFFYARRPLKRSTATVLNALRTMAAALSARLNLPFSMRPIQMEANMAAQDQTKQPAPSGDSSRIDAWLKPLLSRRRLVPLAIALFIALILCMPWNASVGAYGALTAVPGQESIIRAPESAKLIELRVRPGDVIAVGAELGRMSDLELEEQLAQAQVDLDRAAADRDRLLGELGAREESISRAELNLRQRQSDYDESDSERRQIEERERAEQNTLKYLTASVVPTAPVAVVPPGVGPGAPRMSYPAAVAVLQSEADLRQARFSEAALQLDRTRRLYAQGLAPRSDLEKAETTASTLSFESVAARQRMEAFLIEHRRRHAGLATEMQLARSDVGAERLQVLKLNGELRAVGALISTLTDRRDLLRRRLAQFALVASGTGAVFGEELPRMVGQYFPKGAEICRVTDTRQLLARIQASEREIGDVRVGNPVRLKVGAYPDKVFHGRVAKIGGESETDQNNQPVYRVELVIENTDNLLRPGMTAFARIDFGRRMIWAILLHKLKQSLRPELWML